MLDTSLRLVKLANFNCIVVFKIVLLTLLYFCTFNPLHAQDDRVGAVCLDLAKHTSQAYKVLQDLIRNNPSEKEFLIETFENQIYQSYQNEIAKNPPLEPYIDFMRVAKNGGIYYYKKDPNKDPKNFEREILNNCREKIK